MKEKHQCPECYTKAMTKLINLDRWWCTTCDQEIDVDQTIQQWANYGFRKEENESKLKQY